MLNFIYKTVLIITIVINLNTPTHAQSRAVLGDYNNDGLSDIVITRNAGLYKYWFFRYSDATFSQAISFGLIDDNESPADFDGDGDIEPGLTRSTSNGFNLWYVLTNTNLIEEYSWGLENDIFKTGYFDLDTKADLVAIRTEKNNYLSWYIRRSSDLLANVFFWGIAEDTPFIGNFDNDTINDAVIAREVNGSWYWYVKSSVRGATNGIIFGIKNDGLLPPADMDGNGVDDFIIYRTTGLYIQIYIRFNNADGTSSGISNYSYGLKDDLLTVGNYTSSTTATISAFRSVKGKLGTHLIRQSNGSSQDIKFGLGGDTIINSR